MFTYTDKIDRGNVMIKQVSNGYLDKKQNFVCMFIRFIAVFIFALVFTRRDDTVEQT
jgi:hypothetical protein